MKIFLKTHFFRMFIYKMRRGITFNHDALHYGQHKAFDFNQILVFATVSEKLGKVHFPQCHFPENRKTVFAGTY